MIEIKESSSFEITDHKISPRHQLQRYFLPPPPPAPAQRCKQCNQPGHTKSFCTESQKELRTHCFYCGKKGDHLDLNCQLKGNTSQCSTYQDKGLLSSMQSMNESELNSSKCTSCYKRNHECLCVPENNFDTLRLSIDVAVA